MPSPAVARRQTGSSGYEHESRLHYDGTANTMSGGECVLDDSTAKNIFFCLQQAITCGLCASSVIGGPQAAVACALLVCLGSPTALQAIIPELRNDCVVLAERAYDCYTEITEKYPVNPGPITPIPPCKSPSLRVSTPTDVQDNRHHD
jgi:hypothetical protein